MSLIHIPVVQICEPRSIVNAMRALVREKELAITLRKRGRSYREILATVPVAKSTLSEWLRDLALTQSEKKILRHRKDSNITRGRIRAAAALSTRRLEREKILFSEAEKEYENFKTDPLFAVGIALYWAEGSKRNSSFSFTNSDPDMVNLMLAWVECFLGWSRSIVKARLYIHKPYAHENCEGFWQKRISIPIENFQRTIYKPTGLLVKKRPNYKGCLRVHIDKVAFLKKTLFWQSMLIDEYRKR